MRADTLPAAGPVWLALYDVQGRLVRELILGTLSPGEHGVVWDGRDGHGTQVPAGVYLCRLTTTMGQTTHKIVVAH